MSSYLIVGLGNPGPRYEETRHNVGFLVIDFLAKRHGTGTFREKFGGLTTSLPLAGDSHILLKPMEYMNLSGYSVSRARSFRKIPPAHILVIHDEADLPLGTVRIKKGGGHGGHNGLRSIIQQLGSPDFLRIRAGVGKPPKTHERAVADYLLANFPSDERQIAEKMVEIVADAAETLCQKGLSYAMNRFNNKSATSLLAPRAANPKGTTDVKPTTKPEK